MANNAQIDPTLHKLRSLRLAGDATAAQKRRLAALSKSAKERLSTLNGALADEPVRTFHNLSCTGGTLFSKCIAASANAYVLNEIDPLSRMQAPAGKSRFTPTDLVALLRQGDRDLSDSLITDLFLAELDLLRRETWSTGRKLVLRDHTHSHFLYGPTVSDRPTLREIVGRRFPVRSILTVRHPLDSYMSMKKQVWHKHFQPNDFDEYCRRYLLFLDRYQNIEVIKYEDFTASPKAVMKTITSCLDLHYSDQFTDLFSVFRFSGDSGRGGDRIAPHKRREPSEDLIDELDRSENYGPLIKKLGYKP